MSIKKRGNKDLAPKNGSINTINETINNINEKRQLNGCPSLSPEEVQGLKENFKTKDIFPISFELFVEKLLGQERPSAKLTNQPAAVKRELSCSLSASSARYAYEHTRQLFPELNWGNTQFDSEKAYCMAIFSEIAYYSISKLETNQSGRIKVVPCFGYKELMSTYRRVNVRQLINEMFDNEAEVTIVERELSVAIIVRINQVVIIAIRGTAKLYDWLSNIKAIKKRVRPNLKFHRGFYKAADEQIPDLLSEIRKYRNPIELYFTGHSLGGAIAGVLHTSWGNIPRLSAGGTLPVINSSYTFAMPRFCNRATASIGNPNLYHIWRSGDLVPNVPPKLLGYANMDYEFGTDLMPNSRIGMDNLLVSLQTLKSMILGSTIKDHSMELYRTEVASSVGVPRKLELLPIDRTQWPGSGS